MPDYVILGGKTVLDANTDFIGRNITANGTVTVGNTTVKTTITPTGITVNDLQITGNTTLKGTNAGVSTFNDQAAANTVTITANNGAAVVASSVSGRAVVATSNGGSAVDASATTGIAIDADTTSGTAVDARSNSGNGVYAQSGTGRGVHAYSTNNYAIFAESIANTAVYANTNASAAIIGKSESEYGVRGYSNIGGGVYGETKSASLSGILGVSSNGAIYGRIGHAATYSFYGAGNILNTGDAEITGALKIGTGVSNVAITSTSIATALPIIAGNTTVNGLLSTGNTTINGVLSTTGAATLGSATINGALTATGAVSLGATTINGNVTATGNGSFGIATVNYLYVNPEQPAGSEGGQITLKKGAGQTSITTDINIDIAGTDFRIHGNGRVWSIGLTGNGGAIWHSGNFNPANYQPAGNYQPAAGNYIRWDEHIAGSTAYAIYASNGNVYMPWAGGVYLSDYFNRYLPINGRGSWDDSIIPGVFNVWSSSTMTLVSGSSILNLGANDYPSIEITGTSIRPFNSDVGYCGQSSYRWIAVYAKTAAIQTSDARLKKFRSFTQQEMNVARELTSEMGIYQWYKSIEEEGENVARFHAGTKAQSVAAIFKKHGLDPARYSMWCADPVTERVFDADGKRTEEERPVLDANGQPKILYAVRYDELQNFILAAMDQRLDEIEARLAALEA